MTMAVIEHVAAVHDVYSTEEQEAGWVLQHNPQPEVPFQVDDNGKN